MGDAPQQRHRRARRGGRCPRERDNQQGDWETDDQPGSQQIQQEDLPDQPVSHQGQPVQEAILDKGQQRNLGAPLGDLEAHQEGLEVQQRDLGA